MACVVCAAAAPTTLLQHKRHALLCFDFQVLGHICTAMGATNAACPRIRGLAAVTVVNFAHMEQCTLKSLGNVGNLLNALSSVITECRNSVRCSTRLQAAATHSSRSHAHTRCAPPIHPPSHQEQQQALAAVSAVAQVLNDKFMPYYDTFVVAAMKLVDQLTAQTAASTSHADILDTIMLRNVTMETIAIIGEAVGRVRGMRVSVVWRTAGDCGDDLTLAPLAPSPAGQVCC